MGIETLAVASLVASLAAGGVSAVGASTSANANAASSDYKAQTAVNNAVIAKRNADQATEAGQIGAQTNELKNKNLIGTQLVTQASNGLDVGTGTNVNVRDSAEALGHMDTLTILSNAAKNAAGFKAQGMNFTAEGQLDTASATNARTAGEFGVATSLLGAAGSFSDKWAGYSQKGVFA